MCPNAHGWPLKGRQSPSTGSPGIVPTVIPLTQSGFESQNPADSPPKVPAYPRSVQSYTANHPTDGESPAKVHHGRLNPLSPSESGFESQDHPKSRFTRSVSKVTPIPPRDGNLPPILSPRTGQSAIPKRLWLRIAEPPKVPVHPHSVQSYTANHPTDGESPAKVPPRTAQSATPKRAWLRIAESPKVPAQPACVPTYAPSPQETANRHRSSHHGPLIPPSPKRVWLRIAQPPVTQPESPPTRGTPRRSRRPLHVPPNQSGFAAKPPCPSITRSTPPLIVC